ncbi:hypothetical protein [Bergeriella denitrificans]|nr:hypothetical protein [Bergeriella denitrificans]
MAEQLGCLIWVAAVLTECFADKFGGVGSYGIGGRLNIGLAA